MGKTCCNTNVSLLVGMWWSLDSESAMTLCCPGMCWEYNAVLLVINIFSSSLATESCEGCVVGLNIYLNIYVIYMKLSK